MVDKISWLAFQFFFLLACLSKAVIPAMICKMMEEEGENRRGPEVFSLDH